MIINGNDLGLFISGSTGYTNIANDKTCSIEVTAAVIDCSSKDSGKWADKIAGRLSWTASSENLYSEDATVSYATLFAAMVAKTPIMIAFSTAAATKGYTGSAILTKLTINGELDNNSTFNVSLEGTGALMPRV